MRSIFKERVPLASESELGKRVRDRVTVFCDRSTNNIMITQAQLGGTNFQTRTLTKFFPGSFRLPFTYYQLLFYISYGTDN